jgi:ABC-type sugar transport system substrate-binding protein
MPRIARRRAAAMTALAASALALTAACSSASDASSSSSAPPPSTAPSAAASSAAPQPSGGAAASSIPITPKTIGFVEITEAAPVVLETVEEFKRGAAMLGWDVKVVNANADPAQMAAGVSAMVTQGVDAIVTMAIPPAAAAQGLKAAKDKGIPTITVGAPQTDPEGLYDAIFAPDDTKMATMVADQMIKDLNGKGSIFEFKASGQEAIALRDQALREAIKGTDITIAAEHETDLANPIQDTTKAVSDGLRANPDVTAVWAPQDFQFAPVVKTITGQKLGNQGVYTVYFNPEDFNLMREAALPMAIADAPLRYVSWYALDSLVNKLLLDKQDWVTNMDINPLPYVLMTPENVPAEGDAWPYEPFDPFFTQLWQSEGVTLQ